VYKEAMEESLGNAKALLQEAGMVARTVSITHALMLKNLAIEEIAKSLACWYVVAEILPMNHPLVRITGKKSVFRNHDVKNTIYMCMTGTMLLAQWKRMGLADGDDISEGNLFGVGLGATALGPIGTKKRFEWMYVDIVRNKEGDWTVSSPLKLDQQKKSVDFSSVKASIKYLELLMKFMSEDEFEKYRMDRREWFVKNDPDFPKKPRW